MRRTLLLSGGLTSVCAVHCLALVAIDGVEIGLQRALRVSPRYTVAFLVVVMIAGPMQRLRRDPLANRLLANRRQLGLAVAGAHTVHLFVILASFALREAFRAAVDVVEMIPGMTAYAFLYALAFTSNDASVRRLGKRAWKVLHRAGVWVLWFSFAINYGPKSFEQPEYLAAVIPLALVPVLTFFSRR